MTDTYLSNTEQKGYHVIHMNGLYNQAFILGEPESKDQVGYIAPLCIGG